ncbi:poly-beta-1,6-N-acetyl-D-glucosamine biosynthesis protein PgaD [Ammoniphilus sp. 3BR4]|uniref:poly-beta-1,6-N-acetyl-D-glucosamine biosynthesis protein PgaD n=1 Tax=Ammoniphilus sp. 3BR4 TaxID=3158265 RepID=UPI00346799E5
MSNVIDGRQKKFYRFIEIILSILGWLCLIVFTSQVLLLFITFYIPKSNWLNHLILFGIPPVQVKEVILVSGRAVLVSIFIQYAWRSYNYRRFAHMNRRQFPPDVMPSEVSRYFKLSITEIEKMQNEKWIELDKTIV